MRSTNHTRRVWTVTSVTAALLVAGGCASSGGGPIYELRPTTTPLTYIVTSEGGNEIETPGGVQGSTYSTEAVLTLEIGEATDAGRAFVATIESMSLETGGDFGASSQDFTDDIGGKPFRGVIAPDGGVTFTESPEFKRGAMSEADLERVVSGVLFPLPPGGDPAAGPWPHRVTLAPGGGLDGQSVYEGTVTLVGDTTWNGIAASVMASEGLVTMEGTGMPEGAPAEIELATEVEARMIYVWDQTRGVLLEVRASGEGAGDISTMGFSMPMTAASETLITLQQ